MSDLANVDIAADRPAFPVRAVVTAGMPYGNKGLHFGHIGGVFIPADVFVRFLRDRIGCDNVLFISGTDCYGSPIDEGFRKLVESSGFVGSIEDYVLQNHQAQFDTLKSYQISLDIYEGSGLGQAKGYHHQMTQDLLNLLYQNGRLQLLSTAQFYDEQAGSFLNGRQVEGRCPVPGCKSEHGYADECDLGHSYQPEELINPVSNLSGLPPVLRPVSNWYLDLEGFKPLLDEHLARLRDNPEVRKVVADTIAEFLVPPIIYIKEEYLADYQAIAAALPEHVYSAVEAGKQSFELLFANLASRDQARQLLDAHGLRYRSGKALVPFRLTGNIAWGVPAPDLGNRAEALTVWCWPESLWAPISFTQTWLESRASGAPLQSLNEVRASAAGQTWQDYWCSPDARVYQFIGQDNIYFYGVAQTALFSALARPDASLSVDGVAEADLPFGEKIGLPDIRQTHLVANYHLLFLDRKASSSGAVKPPMADELLQYYTAEQLRAHFVSLGLSLKPVSFQPKPLNPQAQEKDSDPVLKDGQVLTNVLNRLARSCFYTAQSEFDGLMPLGSVTPLILHQAAEAILSYEQAMSRQDLHVANQIAAEYIRAANRHWSEFSKAYEDDLPGRRQLLVDCFYLLRVCLLLMHPVAPEGCEKVWRYLNLSLSAAEFFSWQFVSAEGVLAGYEAFCSADDLAYDAHRLQELPPRTDFFERHPSQFQ